MATEQRKGEEHPGIHWGPFTTRIPFYHTRIEWPELAQGVVVGLGKDEDPCETEVEA